MREIQLTHDKVTRVSDEDYESLSQYRWRAWLQKKTGDWYACRTERISIDGVAKPVTYWMHRVILGLTFGDGLHGDHWDHDTLNNQCIPGDHPPSTQNNLRVATHSQNQGNSKKHKVKSSQYKGVSFSKRYGKWAANISINRKQQFLGYRDTEVEAALLYNFAAHILYGDFAALNIIPQQEAA